AGEGDDGLDEAFASARDDEVEPLVHACEGGHAFAIGERDELDGVFRCSGAAECGGDGAVRVDGLAAAAEDGGVSGFEAKDGGVRSDVRAAFVNDADGAYGDADLLDAQSVRALPFFHDLPDGIGE